MLIRSLRLPPSLFVLLIFLAFFGWHLSQGWSHEPAPLDVAGMGNAPPSKDEDDKQPPRVALMTFVTNERSYLHLSLKNHDREHIAHPFIIQKSPLLRNSAQIMPAATATTSS